MPPLLRLVCAALSLMVLSGWAVAAPLLVVVSEDSTIRALTRQELADIYLDRNTARSTFDAVPLDRAEDALRDRYYLALGLTPATVRSHWAKRVFTGRGRPPPTVSAAELGTALSQQKNTLVYVDAAERPRNTRVIATLD